MDAREVTFLVIAISVLLLIIAVFFWLVLITQRVRANKHFYEKQAMQQAFDRQQLESKLEIQEQVFAGISRELHDNVGQVLSLAKVELSIVNEKNELDHSMLLRARDGITRAMSDLRDIAKSLDGDRIQAMKFEEAVSQEVDRINKAGIFSAACCATGVFHEMSGQSRLILFRSVQESLQNIIKHARATNVTISIHYLPDNLEICISDNGKGFDPDAPRAGSGINNIVKRSGQLGGRAWIVSNIDAGTKVNIIVPYE